MTVTPRIASWVCPNCHCLAHEDHLEACPRCGNRLDWLNASVFPTFRESLVASSHPDRQVPSREVRLTMEVRFGKEISSVVALVGEVATLTILGKTVVARPIVGDQGVTSVELQIGDRKSTLQVPCRRSFAGGLELSVWHRVSQAVTAAGPPTIAPPICGTLQLSGETAFGRKKAPAQVQLLHPEIDPTHFVIAREPANADSMHAARFWIADWNSDGITFVDGKSILAQQLKGGELIQAGPFAFVFTADGRLIPQSGITGCSVVVPAGFSIGDRLKVGSKIDVRPGEFVAIVGASGAGKSTLLKAIAGIPGVRGSEPISIDGKTSKPSEFRQILGYLSQDAFVHSELTPIQILGFLARMRCPEKGLAESDFEDLLRLFDLEPSRWRSRLMDMSGGQKKRVRIAAELLATPRLLLLDEPDSGLDPTRSEVVTKLFRNVSRRGCTVLMVSHGVDRLHACDRTIEIGEAKVVKDDPPATPPEKSTVRGRDSWFNQTRSLFGREIALALGDWKGRLGVSFAVPILFAVALAVAIPNHSLDRLGFFCVLSAIWLGASLSLLSIAGEREVFDHESFLFLRTLPYLLAKLVVYSVIASVQTLLFLLVLDATRRYVDRDFFDGSAKTVHLYLALVSLEISGVALGLFLSAFANRSKDWANLLLPLVMIAEMVFSVSANMRAANVDSIDKTYEEFHWHGCAVWPKFWATKWAPYGDGFWSDGVWVGNDAQIDMPKQGRKQIDDHIVKLRRDDPQRAPETHTSRPSAVMSYFFAARYGDILVRAAVNPSNEKEPGHLAWIRDAGFGLATITGVLIAFTLLVLKGQLAGYTFDAALRRIRSSTWVLPGRHRARE